MKIVGVPLHADGARELGVALDVRVGLGGLHVAAEAVHVEAEGACVLVEVRLLEAAAAGEEEVMHLPELPLILRGDGGASGDLRVGMHGQGHELVDETQAALALLPDPIELRRHPLAEGTLEVGELDERGGRILRSARRRPVDRKGLGPRRLEALAVLRLDLVGRHSFAHRRGDQLGRGDARRTVAFLEDTLSDGHGDGAARRPELAHEAGELAALARREVVGVDPGELDVVRGLSGVARRLRSGAGGGENGGRERQSPQRLREHALPALRRRVRGRRRRGRRRGRLAGHRHSELAVDPQLERLLGLAVELAPVHENRGCSA